MATNILIIDDAVENIEIAMSILDGNNYNFSCLTNGEEALNLLKSISFDLILLDIMMPNMDGYEVCKLIKENPLLVDIPIVFLTAKVDEESMTKAFEVGGIDYITKPFHPKEFVTRVKTHLELYKSKQNLKNTINKVEYLNKKLEQIIEKKEEEQTLLLSLFDKGDTVLFKWCSDDILSIKDVSLSVKVLTGYSKDDVVSSKKDYISFVHPTDLDRVKMEVKKAISLNLEFFKHEPYRIIAKNGTVKWVLDYTIIVRDKDGVITSLIGAISDITELKEQEKLIQQQAKLVQMGEMISMIAHQWRQPLGAISSTVIDLQMKIELENFDLDTKEGQENQGKYFLESLKNINEFVQSLTTTIDDFRNFYKPNKKSQQLKLEDVIAKSLTIIKASLLNDNIDIIEDYNSKENIEIYANEMMQVILNVLKNAQDNFKEKEIKNRFINITTKNNILSICDNGGGIPKDIIEKVFDPYFSTKDELNGTGLGLYMSKTIVEEHHNGSLKIENRGDGVCVTIELSTKIKG